MLGLVVSSVTKKKRARPGTSITASITALDMVHNLVNLSRCLAVLATAFSMGPCHRKGEITLPDRLLGHLKVLGSLTRRLTSSSNGVEDVDGPKVEIRCWKYLPRGLTKNRILAFSTISSGQPQPRKSWTKIFLPCRSPSAGFRKTVARTFTNVSLEHIGSMCKFGMSPDSPIALSAFRSEP